MTNLVERYTAESLLLPEATVRVMRPQLRTINVHWHDFYELSLVVEGSADHVVNGVQQAIGPGSAFLLSPADFHEIHPHGSTPLTCYNTVIDPHVMERHLDALGPGGVDGLPWVTDDFMDAEPDFRRLHQEFDGQAIGSSAIADALVTCVVVELARRCNISAAVPATASTGAVDDVRRAVLYVDRHFRGPISLADAAAQAHLSANYFSERFRDYTGSSFQAYLQNRRLRFARSLLGSTELGVTEICHAAGFNDVSHFGRAYRRRYAESPSQYRGSSRSAAAR
jgi:AraC-like DNA-binding protein